MRRDSVSAVFSTGNATTRAVPAVLIPIGLAELCAATSTVLGEDKLLRTSSPPTRGTAAVESRVALAPRLSFLGNRSGTRTGGRHADTTGTFTVNTLLLRPPAPNWQVACGIYPRAGCILPYWQGFWPVD